MIQFKKHSQAFTLLELLIAMSLSSFIILGMIQLHQGVIRYIEGTRSMMTIDREVCLLFNQLERDLSTAYIPFLAKTEKEIPEGKKEDEQPKVQTPEEQKKEEEREKQQRKTFFVGVIDDRADITRIKGKRVELLKYISFICTNPLHIYEEKKQRLVRIVYELAVDKTQSTRDQTIYKLLRKETNDLSNITAKVDESVVLDQKGHVRSYMVADNVKGIFIEYVTKKDDKKDKEKTEETKEIRLSTWGNKEQTQGVVPQKLDIWIDMWNDKKTKTYRFNASFPILGFPTIDENERKKKEKDKTQNAQKQQAAGQTQQTTQTSPAGAQQPPANTPPPIPTGL